MKCFLTSSPFLPDRSSINPANGFADRIRASVPSPCKVLFICSDPDSHEQTDGFAQAVRGNLEARGLQFSQYAVLDGRNEDKAGELVGGAELIILAGGHVPTQNRFFVKVGLREWMRSFDGVLVGISAGTMNSTEVVYAQPELEGEATDPNYQRFLPGLGLTKKMILPHYQMLKDEVLDGLRVMEDIAYPDSQGRRFYLLVDGSYLYIEDGREEVFGEAHLLADGKLSQISKPGESAVL